MESLIRPPLGFAHRGASAHAEENTLDAFRRALELGAGGLETDVWVTEDGAAVLHHDGVLRVGLRRRAVADLARDDLPEPIPVLDELYDACGTDFDLSLDVKDPAAAPLVMEAARRHGHALERLWLCHPDWRQVADWRQLSGQVRLVDSTRLRRIREGPERRAATLAEAGVDAVCLHHTDWTGGLTTLFHRFGRYAFSWDCQHERVLAQVLAMGVDAVYSDHVDRMTQALARLPR
ncbi:MAG TPA: glycerophosphodiester phosphodiesterase [Acidimicrobiales bacterium]|nr:glycerophosphodiester phosphodiesterase [Acidimicrobiales bacterium]